MWEAGTELRTPETPSFGLVALEFPGFPKISSRCKFTRLHSSELGCSRPSRPQVDICPQDVRSWLYTYLVTYSSTDESAPVTDPSEGRLTYADVRLLFDSLLAPSQGSQLAYAAEPLGTGSVRLGKSQGGAPCLILSTQSSVPHQDRHFANLRLRHGLRLRLRTNDDLSTYSVLECVSDDESIRDWFLRLVPSLHAKLAEATQLESVQDLVENIAELFRLIDRDAHRSLTGLWGELALIAASDDPAAAVSAWHVSGESTHDFSSLGFHVEVKASEVAVDITSRRRSFSPEWRRSSPVCNLNSRTTGARF